MIYIDIHNIYIDICTNLVACLNIKYLVQIFQVHLQHYIPHHPYFLTSSRIHASAGNQNVQIHFLLTSVLVQRRTRTHLTTVISKLQRLLSQRMSSWVKSEVVRVSRRLWICCVGIQFLKVKKRVLQNCLKQDWRVGLLDGPQGPRHRIFLQSNPKSLHLTVRHVLPLVNLHVQHRCAVLQRWRNTRRRKSTFFQEMMKC